jgi:hypothetical protein
MIADLTTAWVTLAADNSNLALAQQTLASAENSRKIVARQMAVGTASAGDLSDAESVYQQARASVASYRTQVAQDKNALNLLAGETVPDSLLPGTLESLGDHSISLVPAGVSSSVLLRRPDIQEAEHNLKSANADIGAARANSSRPSPDRQRWRGQRCAIFPVQSRNAGVVVRPIDQPAAVYRRQQSGPAALCGSGEKGIDRHLREEYPERL